MAIQTDVDAAVVVVRICERCARVGRVLVMVLVRGSRGGVRARRCVVVRRRIRCRCLVGYARSGNLSAAAD